MTTVRDLSDEDIAIIKARIERGEKYADIASDYRLNQGRIADFKFGRIRPDIQPATLPGDGSESSTKPKPGGQLPLL
jgi:hypothetical protein